MSGDAQKNTIEALTHSGVTKDFVLKNKKIWCSKLAEASLDALKTENPDILYLMEKHSDSLSQMIEQHSAGNFRYERDRYLSVTIDMLKLGGVARNIILTDPKRWADMTPKARLTTHKSLLLGRKTEEFIKNYRHDWCTYSDNKMNVTASIVNIESKLAEYLPKHLEQWGSKSEEFINRLGGILKRNDKDRTKKFVIDNPERCLGFEAPQLEATTYALNHKRSRALIMQDPERWDKMSAEQMEQTTEALKTGDKDIVQLVMQDPERWDKMGAEQMKQTIKALLTDNDDIVKLVMQDPERWDKMDAKQMEQTVNALLTDNEVTIKLVMQDPERWDKMDAKQMEQTIKALALKNDQLTKIIIEGAENWDAINSDQMEFTAMIFSDYYSDIRTQRLEDARRANRDLISENLNTWCLFSLGKMRATYEALEYGLSGNFVKENFQTRWKYYNAHQMRATSRAINLGRELGNFVRNHDLHWDAMQDTQMWDIIRQYDRSELSIEALVRDNQAIHSSVVKRKVKSIMQFVDFASYIPNAGNSDRVLNSEYVASEFNRFQEKIKQQHSALPNHDAMKEKYRLARRFMKTDHFNSESLYEELTLKEILVATIKISQSAQNSEIPWYKDLKSSDVEQDITTELVYQLAESQRANNRIETDKAERDAASCWEGAVHRTVLTLDKFIDVTSQQVPSLFSYMRKFPEICKKVLAQLDDDKRKDLIAQVQQPDKEITFLDLYPYIKPDIKEMMVKEFPALSYENNIRKHEELLNLTEKFQDSSGMRTMEYIALSEDFVSS